MKFAVGFGVGIKGKRGVRTTFGSQDLGPEQFGKCECHLLTRKKQV